MLHWLVQGLPNARSNQQVEQDFLKVAADGYISSFLAVPALIPLLKSNDRDLRFGSVHALAEFGTNAASAVPALLVSLGDPSAEVESEAAIALGRIGLEPGLVVPAMARATRTSAADISAVRALAMFASQAADELPLLTNLLSHPTWQVRIQATNAIQCITASLLTNRPAH